MGRHNNDILQPDQTMLYSNNVHCWTTKTEATHLQVLHETLDGSATRLRGLEPSPPRPAFHNPITSP
jgi:hypothetical protein